MIAAPVKAAPATAVPVHAATRSPGQPSPLQFAMVAGEPSGDLLAGLLLGAMQTRWPGMHAAGIGGPHMVQRGFAAWWPQQWLAVRGYVEVLPHLRRLLRVRRDLGDRLITERPACFIGVDAPDFNLNLEARLRTAGIPTVHFISPSFWAWRASKVNKLRRSADHVLCIFPFEPALLAQHGIAATFVGHPLAQVIPMVPARAAARAALGLQDSDTVVAVLPGSRASEIKHLAPRFFSACRHILIDFPATKFIIPTFAALRPAVQAAVQASGVAHAIHIVDGQAHSVLAACDLSLIASGTATLEAALFKRPMVIAYHMPWLSWQIMKRKQLQPWVGLPNILCREFVVPELIQDAATPQALAASVVQLLRAPDERERIAQRFTALHNSLKRDTAALACDAIATVLSRPTHSIHHAPP